MRKFLLLVSFTCFIFGGYLVWQRTAPVHPAKTSSFSISIPSLNLTLPVVPTSSSTKTTTKGVSYMTSSAVPGNVGNAVFYGHNWPNLLGPINNLKPGAEIHVSLANGITRKFIITATTIVPASKTDIIHQTSDTRLTIYTCTGIFDQSRFVLTARPL